MNAAQADIAAQRAAARQAETQGNAPEALRLLRDALRADPGDGDTVFALAECLSRHDRLDEAEPYYRQLLAAFPDKPALLNSVAVLMHKTGRRDEAISLWQKVHAAQPKLAAPLVNIGLALRDSGNLPGALDMMERATALEPNHFDAHYNLGSTYYHAGQLEPALTHLEKALEIRPDHARAASMLAQASQGICDWDRLDRLMPRLKAEIAKAQDKKAAAISPWFSVRLPFSRSDRKAIAAATTYVHEAKPPALRFSPGAREKLTIGYMAQDYRDHPGLYLTAGMFRRHDRDRFRILAYPVKTPDAIGKAMIDGSFDAVTDLSALSDADAAQRIHADGVDILVDFSVVGVYTRPGILALRPAPVQASWLGFAGTMSRRLYDYLIGDPVVTPPEHEKDYLETIARLPNCYQINNCDQAIEPSPPRSVEGLPEGAFVFACFCSADRIERDAFTLWMEILRQCPGSVLWLLGSSPTLQANLRRAATGHSIDPARLVFAGRRPKAQHLGRISLADLHLDTFTFGAHTTGSDVLWAGVPMLTMLGDAFPSRVGASLLAAIGLPELIAPDRDAYMRLAVELAHDKARFASLRAKLAANRRTAPLFDTARSVRDHEALYRKMWQAYVAGRMHLPIAP